MQREFNPVRWARPVEGAFAGIITGQVLRTIPLRTPRPTCSVLAGGSALGTVDRSTKCERACLIFGCPGGSIRRGEPMAGLTRLHQHVEHHLWVVDRGWLGDPYNVTETDVLGVIRWAQAKADGHPRVTRAGDPGL